MNYVSKGTELRRAIKELVFDYMSNSSDCGAYADGLKQAEILVEYCFYKNRKP